MNNKITAVLGAALVAMSAASFAQDTLPPAPGTDAARQERMNEAYREHRQAPGPAERAENAIKRGAHRTGEAISNGAHKTGEAISNGAHKTGRAIHRGAKKTSDAFHRDVHPSDHAVHESTDKVTGHP